MAKSNSKLQTLFAMLMFVSGIQLMTAQQINITGTVTDLSLIHISEPTRLS